MNITGNYKILSYIALTAVVIISFVFVNFLLGLIIDDKAPATAVIYIILVLLLNFGMFFIVFRLIQIIVEKDAAIEQLSAHFITLKNDSVEETQIEIKNGLDIDQLVEQIIPTSPQTLGLNKFCDNTLANISKIIEISQGLFYIKKPQTGEFFVAGRYALYTNENIPEFYEGETLPGQVAKDKKILILTEVPANYFVIKSSLGAAQPANLMFIPITEKNETVAVIELAGFKAFNKDHELMFEKMTQLIGKIVLKLK